MRLYLYIILVGLFSIISCTSEGSAEDIQGTWVIEDYLLDDESDLEQNILSEAKKSLEENENNVLYFSLTHTGAIMPNGDTLTSMPYTITDSLINIEGAGSSNFRMKDKNTLQIFEYGSGLIVQFKRKK